MAIVIGSMNLGEKPMGSVLKIRSTPFIFILIIPNAFTTVIGLNFVKPPSYHFLIMYDLKIWQSFMGCSLGFVKTTG